jgi:hemerythrin-like metal-binding protein
MDAIPIRHALDAEHQVIESALDRLKAAVVSGAGQAEFIEILNWCVAYCIAHFAHEEQFLRDFGHSQLEEHEAAHRELSKRFKSARLLAAHDLSMAALDTQDLLHDLYEHIAVDDKMAYEEIEQRSGYGMRAGTLA